MALMHKHWYSSNPPQLPLHFTDQPCGRFTSPVEGSPAPSSPSTSDPGLHKCSARPPTAYPHINLPFANVGIVARFYNAQALNKCTSLSPSTELQFTSHPLHFTPLYTITNRPAINLPLLPFFLAKFQLNCLGSAK